MRVARVLNVEKPEKQKLVDLNLIDHLIVKYKNKKGSMIPLLQGTQEIYGYVPREAFIKLSNETGLKLSDMYGVATFYAQFRLKPAGKNVIKVCHGTACHVQNANSITDAIIEELDVEDGGTTTDGLFTLESVACLGCCSLAPVMMIGSETFGKLTKDTTARAIKDLRKKELANQN